LPCTTVILFSICLVVGIPSKVVLGGFETISWHHEGSNRAGPAPQKKNKKTMGGRPPGARRSTTGGGRKLALRAVGSSGPGPGGAWCDNGHRGPPPGGPTALGGLILGDRGSFAVHRLWGISWVRGPPTAPPCQRGLPGEGRVLPTPYDRDPSIRAAGWGLAEQPCLLPTLRRVGLGGTGKSASWFGAVGPLRQHGWVVGDFQNRLDPIRVC